MICSEIMGLQEKLESQVEANNELKRSLIFMGQELEDVKNENNLIKKELKVVNLSNEKLTKKVVELEVKEKAHHYELNKVQNWLPRSLKPSISKINSESYLDLYSVKFYRKNCINIVFMNIRSLNANIYKIEEFLSVVEGIPQTFRKCFLIYFLNSVGRGFEKIHRKKFI